LRYKVNVIADVTGDEVALGIKEDDRRERSGHHGFHGLEVSDSSIAGQIAQLRYNARAAESTTLTNEPTGSSPGSS
jgi:hypothetical protein